MADTPIQNSEDPADQNAVESGKEVKGAVARFLSARFDLHEDAAYEGQTLESVRRGVPFKGANLWILMFAILICSIGLNVNSPAVVIGAMLISPLMGPILGIGVGVGIYDFDLLLKALKNLAIATVMSIAVSALYFYLSPLSEAQSELLARVSPTIFDVLIATFGGFVGIIAVSRKEKSNALPGVAIATALMPPICTAGYAIAYQEWAYFIGSLYLFFINLVFIAFSTFILVRFMRFSRHSFVDAKQERRVKLWMYAIVALVAIPSVYTAYNTVQDSVFNNRAKQFISNECVFDEAQIIATKITGIRSDSGKVIEIVLLGKSVPKAEIDYLQRELADYGLENTKLKVTQDTDDGNAATEAQLVMLQQQGAMNALYKRSDEQITARERSIQNLKAQLAARAKDTFALAEIITEARVIFPGIADLGLGRLQSAPVVSDTIPLPEVGFAWLKKDQAFPEEKTQALARWLAVRTKLDTVLIYE